MKCSGYYFVMPSTDVPSFVEKYPKIKYTISDRPRNLEMDLCDGNIFLITELIVLKHC
jgi:hypothetical protein